MAQIKFGNKNVKILFGNSSCGLCVGNSPAYPYTPPTPGPQPLIQDGPIRAITPDSESTIKQIQILVDEPYRKSDDATIAEQGYYLDDILIDPENLANVPTGSTTYHTTNSSVRYLLNVTAGGQVSTNLDWSGELDLYYVGNTCRALSVKASRSNACLNNYIGDGYGARILVCSSTEYQFIPEEYLSDSIYYATTNYDLSRAWYYDVCDMSIGDTISWRYYLDKNKVLSNDYDTYVTLASGGGSYYWSETSFAVMKDGTVLEDTSLKLTEENFDDLDYVQTNYTAEQNETAFTTENSPSPRMGLSVRQIYKKPKFSIALCDRRYGYSEGKYVNIENLGSQSYMTRYQIHSYANMKNDNGTVTLEGFTKQPAYPDVI